MGREITRNIRRALSLLKDLRKAGSETGCSYVCAQALGVEVDGAGEVIERSERKQGTVGEFFARSGMRVFSQDVPPDVTGDELGSYLQGPARRFVEGGRRGRIVGHVIYTDTDVPEEGHVVCIPRRDDLPRDFRRELRRRGSFLIVDPATARGVAYTSPSVLADYCNQYTERGVRVEIGDVLRVRGGGRRRKR